jgi:hypothetical protein
MDSIVKGWDSVCRFGQRFGPYLLLEMLLPGGSLWAMLLYLYKRRLAIGAPAFFGVAWRPSCRKGWSHASHTLYMGMARRAPRLNRDTGSQR